METVRDKEAREPDNQLAGAIESTTNQKQWWTQIHDQLVRLEAQTQKNTKLNVEQNQAS